MSEPTSSRATDMAEQRAGGLRAATALRLLAWATLLALVFLTVCPPAFRVHSLPSRSLEHVAAFALLGGLFSWAYAGRRLRLAIGGLAIVVLLEVSQLWIPGRHARFADLVLNSLGLLGGVLAPLVIAGIAGRGAALRSAPAAAGKDLPPTV